MPISIADRIEFDGSYHEIATPPIQLKNRLVKAAMVEGMASILTGLPNELHYTLYRRWAAGGYGMLISGNVIIDPLHSGTPGDLRLPSSAAAVSASDLAAWAQLASSMSGDGAISIMQLVHTGRQSVRCAGRWPCERPLAPSAIRVQTRAEGWWPKLIERIAFQVPREMDEQDIEMVKRQFLRGAELAKEAGFHGIEIHASHGYLLSSFISPRSNKRTDRYGGSAENRLRLLLEVISLIRQDCPSPFIIGVKLNSADYMEGGLAEEEALLHIRQLTTQGMLDFIEISGGSYESLAFLDEEGTREQSRPPHADALKDEQKAYSNASYRSSRTARREAIFSSFCSHAKAAVNHELQYSPDKQRRRRPFIMCTGGFKTLQGMNAALNEDGIDLIGLGRAAAVDPDLPNRLIATITGRSSKSDGAQSKDTKPSNRCIDYEMTGGAWLKKLVPLQLVGGSLVTKWHQSQMFLLAQGREPRPECSFEGLLAREVWDGLSGSWTVRGLVVVALAVLTSRALAA